MAKYIVEMDLEGHCDECLFLRSDSEGDKCNITDRTVRPLNWTVDYIRQPSDCPLKEIDLQSAYQIEFDFKRDSNWAPDPYLRRFDDLAKAVGEAVLECGRGKFGNPPAVRVVEESVLPKSLRSRVVWQMEQ